MTTIHGQAEVIAIEDWTLVRLPESVSAKLPSRGMNMVEGTLNGFPVQVPLEPDGKGSHWFKIDDTIGKEANVAVGDTVELMLEPVEDWSEPEVPADLMDALVSEPEAHQAWEDVTTKARWDWIRWIRSTKQPNTRKKRIETACSMLKSGKRRPCCFNRNLCTETAISKSGVLLELRRTR